MTMSGGVTAASVRPTRLPWVELADSGLPRNAPHVSCVYFVTASNGRILYIGETSDLGQRLYWPGSHHRLAEVRRIDRETRIYYGEWKLPREPLIDVARSILARKEFEADCIIRFDPVLNHQGNGGKRWGGKTGITGLEYARTTPNGNREIPRRPDDGREERLQVLVRRLTVIENQKEVAERAPTKESDWQEWQAKKQARRWMARAKEAARYEKYARKQRRLAEIGKPAGHALIVVPTRARSDDDL